MSHAMKIAAVAMLAASGLMLAAEASAGTGKEKEPASQGVDSGSFGVFMNGHRVATETFSIQQNSAGSVVTSEFKAEQGTVAASQSSELQLSSTGDLKKYEWKELSPGKAQAVVVPNEDFLIERFTNNPLEKEQEQPFLLPASTNMLDDYFFVQREVLAWKYLASGCRQENGQVKCPLNQKTLFGSLNPHARSSMSVSMEYSGREKIAIHGAERELIRLNLKSDTGDWALWLDDQFKLVRIVVSSDHTEVVRD